MLPEIFLSILKWAPYLHTSLHILLIISFRRFRDFDSHLQHFKVNVHTSHTQISSQCKTTRLSEANVEFLAMCPLKLFANGHITHLWFAPNKFKMITLPF